MTSALIDAQTLATQKAFKIVDASFHLPAFPYGIAGAVDFDIDDIADPTAPLAHTVPDADTFAAKVGALGISNADIVVVYDRSGMAMAAARAWWMFRLFGHDKVFILDGGLPAWVNAGLPLEPKNTEPTPAVFTATLRPHLLKTRDDILANLNAPSFQVLDARDAARFSGMAADPRPQVAAGHIPGSINTPFTNLLTADGFLKPRTELTSLLPDTGAVACSCGSGVTACVVALALYELGHHHAAVYDGSWTEWGSDPTLPKATGV